MKNTAVHLRNIKQTEIRSNYAYIVRSTHNTRKFKKNKKPNVFLQPIEGSTLDFKPLEDMKS